MREKLDAQQAETRLEKEAAYEAKTRKIAQCKYQRELQLQELKTKHTQELRERQRKQRKLYLSQTSQHERQLELTLAELQRKANLQAETVDVFLLGSML